MIVFELTSSSMKSFVWAVRSGLADWGLGLGWLCPWCGRVVPDLGSVSGGVRLVDPLSSKAFVNISIGFFGWGYFFC